jgi:hypothetical protein
MLEAGLSSSQLNARVTRGYGMSATFISNVALVDRNLQSTAGTMLAALSIALLRLSLCQASCDVFVIFPRVSIAKPAFLYVRVIWRFRIKDRIRPRAKCVAVLYIMIGAHGFRLLFYGLLRVFRGLYGDYSRSER